MSVWHVTAYNCEKDLESRRLFPAQTHIWKDLKTLKGVKNRTARVYKDKTVYVLVTRVVHGFSFEHVF